MLWTQIRVSNWNLCENEWKIERVVGCVWIFFSSCINFYNSFYLCDWCVLLTGRKKIKNPFLQNFLKIPYLWSRNLNFYLDFTANTLQLCLNVIYLLLLLSFLVRNGEAEEGLTEIEDFPDVSLPCSVLLAHIRNPHETFGIFLQLYMRFKQW